MLLAERWAREGIEKKRIVARLVGHYLMNNADAYNLAAAAEEKIQSEKEGVDFTVPVHPDYAPKGYDTQEHMTKGAELSQLIEEDRQKRKKAIEKDEAEMKAGWGDVAEVKEE